MSKRSRAKGRASYGERFAKIPVEVLEHAAVTTLTYAERWVLVVIASGYTGRNNGTLALTETWGKRFGITGTDTVSTARRRLVERGLLEITRPGDRMRRIPTLYGLTWQPIDNRDAQPLERPQPASWRFRNWQPTKNSTPADRGSVSPSGGVETAETTPIQPVRTAETTPSSGETLRSRGEHASARGSPNPSRRSSSRAVSFNLADARGRVAKLRAEQPHLTARDLARACRIPDEYFAAVLQDIA